MKLKLIITVLALGIGSTSVFAEGKCAISSDDVKLIQEQLSVVITSKDKNGGLFSPNRMWSAVVDRKGVLCSVIGIGDVWPGSRSIAIAKASAANDFSNDVLPLSTANLYAPAQPGGFLYGLKESNPFNPAFQAQGSGIGEVPGGVVIFGGGVPLYKNGEVIGGLGVSGDTACADHTIAYRMRRLAGFDHKMPAGVGFNHTDNIDYDDLKSPPSKFKHPHCTGDDISPEKI